jgi:membrane protein implicated in regulation of membrane protease activity
MQGTWRTTGGDGKGALVAAGVIAGIILASSGALAGAVAAAVSFLEILALCAVAFLAILAVACFLLWRKYGRHERVPEQLLAFHEARRVQAPRENAAIATPAQHLHFHFEGNAQPEAVLRAIAESKQQGEQS